MTGRIGRIERAVLSRVDALPKSVAVMLAVIGLLLVAATDTILDKSTGYNWTLTLGYMLPVGFMAWSLGFRAGAITAVVAVILESFGAGSEEVLQRHSAQVLLGVELLQLALLLVGAFLTSRMRLHLEVEKGLSRTDHLTGCWNARAFWEAMDVEKERMGRTSTPLSVVFFDVDDFKTVNDRYGHAVGDRVLRTVGDVLRAELRITDLSARLGGDEFAIILPATDSALAVRVADRVRTQVSRLTECYQVHTTLSVGVITYTGAADSIGDLVATADKLMYSAKHQGKNALAFEVA